MYAQRDEDNVTLLWFKGKNNGRFLDIGAYDWKAMSQTRGLYERGWSGVMVEGAAVRFAELMKQYGGDPRITLVHAVLYGSEAGFIPFHQNQDATSTLDDEHKDIWAETTPFTRTFAHVVTYEQLVKAFPEPYDFINIDVEGSINYDIFAALMRVGTKASFICVEFGKKADEILELAAGKGFKEIHRTPENLLLGKE